VLGSLAAHLRRESGVAEDRSQARNPARVELLEEGAVRRQYTPSTTLDLKPEKGRTFRTPSQG
jgi:hypothetical protein